MQLSVASVDIIAWTRQIGARMKMKFFWPCNLCSLDKSLLCMSRHRKIFQIPVIVDEDEKERFTSAIPSVIVKY